MVARNANKAIVAPMLRYGEVCIWQEFGYGRHKDFFTKNILLYKKIWQLYFNAIYKENIAINFITVQHKKGLFLQILASHNTLCLSDFDLETTFQQ